MEKPSVNLLKEKRERERERKKKKNKVYAQKQNMVVVLLDFICEETKREYSLDMKNTYTSLQDTV